MAHRHASGNALITVASIKSLVSGDRLAKFDVSRFKLIIIDEAHHAVAAGYRRVLAHFGANTASTPPRVNVVGFSATLSRHDSLALQSVFDEIVYHMDFIDMIKAEW